MEPGIANLNRFGWFVTPVKMILDSPSSLEALSKQLFRITPDFYHHAAGLGLLDEEVELIEGLIIRKMPKSPFHQWLVRFLAARLSAHVDAAHAFIAVESPITTANSEPEPDIAVFAGNSLDYRTEHPGSALLVMEVAVTSLILDREKCSVYAACGVNEYWIINAESKCIEFYNHPSSDLGKYLSSRSFTPGEVCHSTIIPGFDVAVGELFGNELR